MEQIVCNERLILDASASHPFEIFAQLEALMCHSLSTPEKRDRIARGICADLVEQQCELQPELAASLRANFPQHRKSLNRVSLARQGVKWEDAQIAGWYFLILLNKQLTGEDPAFHGAPQKVSGHIVLVEMFPDRENGSEEHYESRLHDKHKHLIRRHYPVAHLAAAFATAAQIASPNDYAGECQIHNLAFLRALVILAGGYADVIRQTPELANVADKLIELEWRD